MIYETKEVKFTEGESCFDILERELKNAGILIESSITPATKSVYIEGINNLYEFDCGKQSGWMYTVNGDVPNVSCSEYKIKENDEIKITVIDNQQEYIRTAKMKKLNNRIVIGILISELYDLNTDPNIQFNFDKSETGPSGGLMLSLAIYDYLTNEDIARNRKIVGTGTIDSDGKVGSIGGVKYKLKGAVKNKADIFIVPDGENYEEVMKLVNENNYNIKIIKAITLDNVIEELKK